MSKADFLLSFFFFSFFPKETLSQISKYETYEINNNNYNSMHVFSQFAFSLHEIAWRGSKSLLKFWKRTSRYRMSPGIYCMEIQYREIRWWARNQFFKSCTLTTIENPCWQMLLVIWQIRTPKKHGLPYKKNFFRLRFAFLSTDLISHQTSSK